MPIQATVQNNQIQASVGETQIDVSVSGGFGPSGLQGPAATIAVGTVTTGAPGSSASVVNAGTTSAAVLNFSIPRGDVGATGSQGPAGAAATVAVGTVSTGAAGSSAAVVNAGSSSAAVLNFTIPRGDVGATGPQGPAGPAGTTTWAGLTGVPSTFPPSTHTHVAADITDFTSAVIAAAPPTTNASLLTSGTISADRIPSTIARTSDVSAAVSALVNSAPAALDTLKELADALGSDANFSTTVTNSLAAKAPINNPTFTGTVGGITKGMVGLGNVDNTSDANKPVSTAQAAADAAVQAHAIQRANHTGTQTASTISDFNTAASAAAPVQSVAGRTGTVTLAVADVSGAVASSDSRLTDARTPTAHTHGNITNDGKIGTASGKAVVTGENGVLQAAEYVENARFLYDTANSWQLFYFQDVTPVWTATAIENDIPDQFRDSIGAAAAIHTHNASDISAGTLNASRLPNTAVTAGSYGSGTAVATFTVDGTGRLTAAGTASITPAGIGAASASHAHSALDITSGTIATARLGSGTASSTTFLRGDNTWAAAGSTNASDLTTGTLANARMTTRARAAMNTYLWSSFR